MGSLHLVAEQPLLWLRDASGESEAITVAQWASVDLAGLAPWRVWRSRRGQPHMPGTYWAATTGGHVEYESRLELSRLLLADFDPVVKHIWAQPFRLEAVVNGRRRRHVPDFLLRLTGGQLIVVNVKPAVRLEDPRTVERLSWPQEVLSGHGFGYEVWVGTDAVLLANIRFLAGYRRHQVIPAEDMRSVAGIVTDGEQLAVAERRIAAGLHPHQVRPFLLAALWFGLLTTDLTRPLSGASVLRKESP